MKESNSQIKVNFNESDLQSKIDLQVKNKKLIDNLNKVSRKFY